MYHCHTLLLFLDVFDSSHTYIRHQVLTCCFAAIMMIIMVISILVIMIIMFCSHDTCKGAEGQKDGAPLDLQESEVDVRLLCHGAGPQSCLHQCKVQHWARRPVYR